jgi:uncharacterized protein (TIGR00255 family)
MKRPLSMTAFGRGEAGVNRHWTVELRSVNHRFCDIKVKLPREYGVLEDKIKKEIGTVFSRGHIEVLVTVSASDVVGAQAQVNLPLANQYMACLKQLQSTFNLHDRPTLAMLAAYKDVISEQKCEEDLDSVWAEIREALVLALTACLQMRFDEGLILKNDLLVRLHSFEATVTSIACAIPGLVGKREATLKERLAALLSGGEVDPIRLTQEVVILADRYDVTEELVRLKSHIQQFRAFMELDEPVGRRLDFLLQEFLREINTLSSKINDTEVIHKTVDLKNEIEKIREQAQNLE